MIYLVSSGDYSDYRVHAIFDDKQLAQNYIDAFSGGMYGDVGEIEEYKLNPLEQVLSKKYSAYEIKMDREGNVVSIEKGKYYNRFSTKGVEIFTDHFFFHQCFAKDEEHATKITNEKRIQLIALNKWNLK